MTLALTPEQTDLTESVGQFAHRRAPLSAARDAFEMLGKAALPGPLLPTVTASAVTLLAESSPAAHALLTLLAGGAPAAPVLPQTASFHARADGDRWLITGESDVIPGSTPTEPSSLPMR